MANLMYVMSFFEETPPEGEFFYDPDNYHVTLLPEFTVPDRNLGQWLSMIQELTETHSPFSVVETQETFLGANLDIPATEVASSPVSALKKLHTDLWLSLHGVGGSPQTEYVLSQFSPHISFKSFAADRFPVTGFSVIHHRSAFGVDVQNLRNYTLKG